MCITCQARSRRSVALSAAPCADLIDLDYGYGSVFYHTPQDTLDKFSPKSLEIVGGVILETVQLLEQRK